MRESTFVGVMVFLTGLILAIVLSRVSQRLEGIEDAIREQTVRMEMKNEKSW